MQFEQFEKIKKHAPKFRAFVRKTKRQRKLKADLKKVNAEIEELVGTGDSPTDLISIFTSNRLKNVPGIDGMTIFLKRKVYAGNVVGSEDKQKAADNKKKIIEALKTVGLPEYTDETFSGASLGAYFKEQQEQKEIDLESFVELSEVIPDALKDLIKVSEVFSIVGTSGEKA